MMIQLSNFQSAFRAWRSFHEHQLLTSPDKISQFQSCWPHLQMSLFAFEKCAYLEFAGKKQFTFKTRRAPTSAGSRLDRSSRFRARPYSFVKLDFRCSYTFIRRLRRLNRLSLIWDRRYILNAVLLLLVGPYKHDFFSVPSSYFRFGWVQVVFWVCLRGVLIQVNSKKAFIF